MHTLIIIMFVHTVIMVIEPHMKQGRQHKLISTIFLATSVTKKLDHNNLQAKLEKDGWTSEYQNGQNQWGTKKSPEAETYIALSKNYAAVIKQLTELVPAAKRKTSRLAALREE